MVHSLTNNLYLPVIVSYLFCIKYVFSYSSDFKLPSHPDTSVTTPTTSSTTFPTGHCTSEKFLCSSNNICLDKSVICDFRIDCAGGPLEQACGKLL